MDEFRLESVAEQLREIENSALPTGTTNYRTISVTLVNESDRWTASCVVRDTDHGTIHVADLANWTDDTARSVLSGRASAVSAFVWLLHAHLDEWWMTTAHKPSA